METTKTDQLLQSYLQLAFDELPDVFTGKKFAKTLKARGVYCTTTMRIKFLHENAKHYNSRENWVKNKYCAKQPEKDNVIDPETKCINFLISRGYKILKPITEWVELT
jgi:hypothetical protein